MSAKMSKLSILSFMLFTILIIHDFFPSFFFLNWLNGSLFWVVLVFCFFIGFTGQNDGTRLLLDLYLVMIMFLLSLIGGKSLHGIDIWHPVFWGGILLVFYDFISFLKKKKKQIS